MVRWRSAFMNSMRGFGWAIRNEASVREEVVALVVGLPLAWAIAPDWAGWCVLVGAMALLLAIELLNTAIEKLADFVTLEHRPAIGVVKDLGSAAVFCMLALNAVLWFGMAARKLLA